MANRAYLYFCEDVSSLCFEMHYRKSDGSRRSYIDSRHRLPLAWFLFFESASIRLIPSSDGEWNELYFVRLWSEARAAFEARVPQLVEWFEDALSPSDIDEFLQRIDSLSESPDEVWLVLDPNELQIDDESSVQLLRDSLSQLDDTTLTSEQRYEIINQWSSVGGSSSTKRQTSELRDRVFGFYYGPTIPGYFLPRQSWQSEINK